MQKFATLFFTAAIALAPVGGALSKSSDHEDANKTEQAAPVIADKATIDSALQHLVEDGSLKGVSALVYKDGKEVYYGAFGMADDAKKRPMKRNTLVQIFSMTKPTVGVSLMTLYEKGLFKLDDPITKYVPELASLKVYAGEDKNGNPILKKPTRMPTVRDFMRHTAGLMSGSAGSENPKLAEIMREADATAWTGTLEEMPAKLARVPLLYNPGERWLYSDAVEIQALMVERLSGEPYAQYVQEHVFDPLGMKDTAYYVPEKRRDRLAALYQAGAEGGLTRMPDEDAYRFNTNHWSYTPGSFGLTSTLDDYMKFARMLLNGGELDGVRILKPETIKLMATSTLSDDVTDRSWLPSKGQVGFGIDFAVRVSPPQKPDENYGFVGEFFWDGAASTLFWVDPTNNLTSVLFLQRFPFYGRAHKVFRDAVYGVPERG